MDDILKDIGCDKKTIERIEQMQREGNSSGVLRIFVEHRQKLLDCVHKCEKQISSLDYYVYCLKKETIK